MRTLGLVFVFGFIFGLTTLKSQENKDMNLPYHSIPEAPEDYSSGNVLSRMIDGLGYRYYWASEGLRDEDLRYKPSEDARSTMETLQHIHGLAESVLKAAQDEPNIRPAVANEMDYETLRKSTLEQLMKASTVMRGKSAEEVSALKVVFQRGDKVTTFPYWNLINGQISDAIYHTGQLVSFRRTSGNPSNPGVSVFTGKTKEK